MRGYRVPSSLIDKIEREALHIGDFSYTDGMDKVIDAIKDLGEVELDNPWHTGTPTEKGDYLVKLDVEHHVYPYYVLKWENGWYSHYDMDYPACPKHRVIKWQKIEDTDK